MNDLNTTPDTNSATEAVQDSAVQEQAVDVQAAQTDTGSEQTEETFFDPKKVPEALLPAYKQMQADYTRKTQEVAKRTKEYEELRQKAEAYAKYEKFTPILEEMLGTQASQADSPEMEVLVNQLRQAGYSDDAIELMKMGAKFTLGQFERTQNAKVEQENFNKGVDAAEKVDPRLTDTNLTYQMEDGSSVTFGQIVAEMVSAMPDWRSDPVKATQLAIKKVDALIGTAKKQGKQELSEAAKGKANRFPQTSSSPAQAVDTNKPMSMREAAEKARESLGI